MYRGETCEDCGFPVAFFTRSYWIAADDLWNEIIGALDNPRGEGVVLCPPCFSGRADVKGIHVHWVAARTEEQETFRITPGQEKTLNAAARREEAPRDPRRRPVDPNECQEGC
jgi:hypothetical protein